MQQNFSLIDLGMTVYAVLVDVPKTKKLVKKATSGRKSKGEAVESADQPADKKKAAAKKGYQLGQGFANYVESSIGSPREQAEITVNIDGNVDLVIGTQPSGQGHETSFAQVAADLIGIDVKNINIILLQCQYP